MKCKVDIAIEKAFDALQYAVEKTDDANTIILLQDAMLALKPFYHNLAATYDDERRQYWIEMMDIHFDGHFKDFTPEETDRMVEWLREWDDGETHDDVVADALLKALHETGLGKKVYGE